MSDDKDKLIEELRQEIRRLKIEKEKMRKEFEEFKAKHSVTVSNLSMY